MSQYTIEGWVPANGVISVPVGAVVTALRVEGLSVSFTAGEGYVEPAQQYIGRKFQADVEEGSSATPGVNPKYATAVTDSAAENAQRSSRYSGRVVAPFDTLSGYSGTNGATIQLVDVPTGGPRRIKGATAKSVQVTGEATNLEVNFPVFEAGNPTGRVDLWLYVTDYTKHSAPITLFLTVDSGYANHYTRSFNIRQHNGWQCVSLTVSNFTVGAGSPTLDTVTRGKIRFNAPGGCGIIVDRLVFGGGGSPLVTLIWDDGGITDYTIIAPLLNKYRLQGNFAIIGAIVGDTPTTVMSRTQLYMMAESGHRLITHGQYNLSTLPTPAAAIADVESNRAFLDGLGIEVDSDVYVYPQGEYMHTTGDLSIPNYLRSAGFAGAFIASGSCVSNAAFTERYACQRKGVDASTVASTWLAQFDEHIAAGMSVALMGHNVVTSGATGAAANLAVIDAVLAGIASRRDAGKINVVSARAFCRRAMPG